MVFVTAQPAKAKKAQCVTVSGALWSSNYLNNDVIEVGPAPVLSTSISFAHASRMTALVRVSTAPLYAHATP